VTGKRRKPGRYRMNRADPHGAIWCEHISVNGVSSQRRECAKTGKQNGTRCHQQAIAGIDACRTHCGQKRDDAKAKGQANIVRARFRDVDASEYVDPGDVLAWAVTVAFLDIADYRREIASRAAEKDAKISAEELDRLMRMEADIARISKMALDAGVNERQIRMAERVAEQLVTVLRGVVQELGHDPADPKVAKVIHSRLQLVAGGKAS
jgi:hypothetical protein